MTNETPVTNTVTRETTFVCGDCLLKAEQGEGTADSMKNLPGYWDYIGHGWEMEELEECETCNGEINYLCEYMDGESSPRWVCPGCDVTDTMFNEMYKIEKAD